MCSNSFAEHGNALYVEGKCICFRLGRATRTPDWPMLPQRLRDPLLFGITH
jgi:hypothetical protein